LEEQVSKLLWGHNNKKTLLDEIKNKHLDLAFGGQVNGDAKKREYIWGGPSIDADVDLSRMSLQGCYYTSGSQSNREHT